MSDHYSFFKTLHNVQRNTWFNNKAEKITVKKQKCNVQAVPPNADSCSGSSVPCGPVTDHC